MLVKLQKLLTIEVTNHETASALTPGQRQQSNFLAQC